MKESEKKTEVAVNTSSGAEKVETIVEEKKTPRAAKKATAPAKKAKAKKTEKEAAKERVEKALQDKERKEKRAAEKKAKAEKRAAARKAKAEKRKAERAARAEKRKAEREERIRRRAHAKAQRKQKKNKTKEDRKQRRSEQKGQGGWIAAVVSLGVVTLALGTTVTVGAIDMANTKNGVTATHRAMTYELVGVLDNVDDDLDRVRVSASTAQQQRILTDLLVQSRVAALDLEKLPVTSENNVHFLSFINRIGRECERMLSKLRNGETLSERDGQVLQELYETNGKIRKALDEYAAQMTDNDIVEYVKKGEGRFYETIADLEQITLPENRETVPPVFETDGAGMRSASDERVKSEPSRAEELALTYFEKYPMREFSCVGECKRKGMQAYTVQGYDDDGDMLFAEIDAFSGALLTFNYYKVCDEERFDLPNSQTIAEEFLQTLGYENMYPVRVSENGTDGDFTFVYEQDGVICYPDCVKVKVCRTRGTVTGLDASAFLKNHRERTLPTAKLSIREAEEKLCNGFEVQHACAALVQTVRGERLAYEFFGGYQDGRYLIYLDAQTGEEISIVNIKNLG